MLVIDYQVGKQRRWGGLFVLVLCCALIWLLQLPGALLAGIVLGRHWISPRAKSGLWVINTDDGLKPLWLDESFVVLGDPYRVIYRDEVAPEMFCRLRRRCLGLPC